MSSTDRRHSGFIGNPGFVDLLAFMDVPGGFAPGTVAAPGAISLEKVSTGVWIPGVRFWISSGLCNFP